MQEVLFLVVGGGGGGGMVHSLNNTAPPPPPPPPPPTNEITHRFTPMEQDNVLLLHVSNQILQFAVIQLRDAKGFDKVINYQIQKKYLSFYMSYYPD